MKTEVDGRKGFVYGLLRTLEVPLFLSSSVCFCFFSPDQYVTFVKIIGVSIIVSNLILLIAYAVKKNANNDIFIGKCWFIVM